MFECSIQTFLKHTTNHTLICCTYKTDNSIYRFTGKKCKCPMYFLGQMSFVLQVKKKRSASILRPWVYTIVWKYTNLHVNINMHYLFIGQALPVRCIGEVQHTVMCGQATKGN